MNGNNLKQRSLNGFVWKLSEKVGTQAVQFVLQIILARILFPEDYGIVGMLAIFISISDVFINMGFTTALIQKKNADDTDFSSVFFANIALALVLYGIMFAVAPLVAAFYNEPMLTPIMRVFSLNVVIGAFSAVHNAVLAKNLEFKKSFFRGLFNILTYGVVGIVLAYHNFGAWALVYARLAGVFVGAVVLWLTVKWHPKKIFSIKRIKELFRFSSKVLGVNLLNTVFNNIHSLIIGRYYNKEDLGQYQRGQQIPQTVMNAVDGSMSEVMYPTFSHLQSDLPRLKSALRRSMKVSMYVVFPILLGLLVTAEPLTLFLLTDKWLPSVPYMQLTCIICMFWPLSARSHALNAIGKSGLTFKISLISKAITLACILIFVKHSIFAIMISTIAASCISFFIVSHFVKKYLGYRYRELAIDILPSLALSVVMAVSVYLVNLINLSSIVTLIIQIPLGIIIYVVGSAIFHFDSFKYIISLIRSILHRNKKQDTETEIQ